MELFRVEFSSLTRTNMCFGKYIYADITFWKLTRFEGSYISEYSTIIIVGLCHELAFIVLQVAQWKEYEFCNPRD